MRRKFDVTKKKVNKLNEIIKWVYLNHKTIWIEFHYNLKHWGKNIEFCHFDEVTPYFRFYFIFIFCSKPIYID